MGSYMDKKINDAIRNMDPKDVEKSLNNAIEMLRKGDPEALAKKIGRIDKQELLNKLNDLDKDSLKKLNVNIDDVKKKVTQQDLDQLGAILGRDGDKIIAKLNDLMK